MEIAGWVIHVFQIDNTMFIYFFLAVPSYVDVATEHSGNECPVRSSIPRDRVPRELRAQEGQAVTHASYSWLLVLPNVLVDPNAQTLTCWPNLGTFYPQLPYPHNLCVRKLQNISENTYVGHAN